MIRILLVDGDQDLLANRYREQLAPYCDLTTTNAAETAATMLAAQPFDCVIAHHELPTHSGLWLLERARRRRPTSRRILISGTQPPDLSRFIDNGTVHHFFATPMEPRHILAATGIAGAGVVPSTPEAQRSDRAVCRDPSAPDHVALQISESSLQEIIDQIPDPVLVADAQRRVHQINRSLRDQGNIPLSMLKGASCRRILKGWHPPCIQNEANCPVERVFTTKQPLAFAHEYSSAAGVKETGQTNATPLLDAAGAVRRVIVRHGRVTPVAAQPAEPAWRSNSSEDVAAARADILNPATCEHIPY